MGTPDFASMPGEQILDAVQQYAILIGASDIHFSPERDGVRFEFRLHGMLESLPPITHAAYEQVLRKIKFAAKLKLNIANVPQDGQFTCDVAEQGSDEKRIVNIRAATLPTHFGETVTLRVLDPKRGILSLEQLGFPETMAGQLGELARLPHGLILVTGPTGSGKTTTLYALLSTLIGKRRNVITLEDPIEYEINGIVQSEIDPDHGFTFASGLRSVLRHDPNVVFVGEIRDLETAQTAIDAALTGHLVLSTLHTNSAIEAIPRMLSMGVSPYTFAPALRGILGQRLVRRLSEAARSSGQYDPADSVNYDGRIALPELLIVTAKLRDMILAQEQETALSTQAGKDGFLTMKEFGALMVQAGITTKEEVERVTS